VDISVNQRDLDRVLRELKTIDDKSVRVLRSKLKTGLAPIAGQIKADIPREAPLSGMQRSRRGTAVRGRTKWRGVNKPVISFTPGRSKKSGTNLLMITMTGGKRGLGFDYAELAGIRSRPGATISREYTRRTGRGGMTRPMTHRVTTQGDKFIDGLNADKQIRGKAGRYAYDSFLKHKPQIVETSRLIINGFMASYKRKFSV